MDLGHRYIYIYIYIYIYRFRVQGLGFRGLAGFGASEDDVASEDDQHSELRPFL